jgi:hypothetical protein
MDSSINITKIYCGVHPNASVKWQNYFHEVYLGMNYFTMRCLFSELIPTGMIILFNSYIIYHIIRTYRRLNPESSHQSRKNQSRTTSWMNIVLILHSLLFLASLCSHIVGHFTVVGVHETWWVLLSVLINCSLNFYIYCLSGKAFRNEIRRFIHRLKIRIFNGTQTRQQQAYRNRRFNYEMRDFHGMSQP